MQAAPENWNELFAREHQTDVRVRIAGTVYEAERLISCNVGARLFETLGIGNACAATLRLGVLPQGTIPRAAKLELSVRLRDGGTVTAWLPQGTFWVDERSEEDGVLSLITYDRLRMAEQDYFSDGVISGTWPSPAPAVVSAICTRLGTSLDPRTALDASLLVDCPVGLSVREVLCGIAAAHGGNWTMTAADTLRLVPVEDLPDPTFLGDEAGNFVADEFGSRVMILEGEHLTVPCGGLRRTADPAAISHVSLNLDDETGYTAGDDSGFSLKALCPYATQLLADAVLSKLRGVRYNAVEVRDALCDPRLELGDVLYGGGVIFRAETIDMDYGAACVAEIAAPVSGEVEHEFPYQDKSARAVNRKIAQAKAELRLTTERITAEVAAVDGRVSTVEQTADGLTATVTGLDGRVSTVEQTASGLTSTVAGLDGDVSALYQKVDSITLEVTNHSVSSTISLSVDGIELSSQRIQFTGDVVFASDLYDGVTEISGDCITTGEISARYIKLGGQMEVYRSLSSNTCGGYLGYMTGMTATGASTSGIGIANDAETAVVICTTAGARMGFDGTSSVVCTGGKVTLTADQVVVDGTLKSADGTVITSDRSAKKHISYRRMGKYLRLFDLLRPAVYRLKGRRRRHLGFIAQDVEEALAAAGIASEDFAGLCVDSAGGYGLRYEEFIPLLVAKVQQLEGRIRELEERDG